MKRILIHALSALQGGGLVYLRNLLGHCPETVRPHISVVCPEDLASVYQGLNVDVVVPGIRNGILDRTVWENTALPRIAAEYDVFFAPGGIIPSRLAKQNRLRKVTMLQNMLPFVSRERNRYGLSWMWLRLWLLKRVLLAGCRRADGIVFISRFAQQRIRRLLPSIEKKDMVIPHGVSTACLQESAQDEPALPFAGPFYLYVSILDVYKAQLEVVETWRLLKEKYKRREKLILAGPAYPPYGRRVKALIERYGLSDQVLPVGEIPHDRIGQYYGRAEAVIFASSCENCPSILLESMASGKPVLCSKYKPMPEFAGDTVRYFDPYEPAQLAEAIMEIENKPGLGADYAQKAKQQSLRYRWQDSAQKTFTFLLEDNPGQS